MNSLTTGEPRKQVLDKIIPNCQLSIHIWWLGILQFCYESLWMNWIHRKGLRNCHAAKTTLNSLWAVKNNNIKLFYCGKEWCNINGPLLTRTLLYQCLQTDSAARCSDEQLTGFAARLLMWKLITSFVYLTHQIPRWKTVSVIVYTQQ